MFTIGVDFGGTKILTGVVNTSGKVVKKVSLPTEANKGPKHVINQLVKSIKQVIKEAKIDSKEILGVGIGAPGALDANKGIIHFAPNLPGWKEVPLKQEVERRINLPVYVDNDANMAALGEAWVGSGKDKKNLICITLGTGVGGGLILNGELYRGATTSAGEIGHITVDPNGPRCNCGNYGCLEAFSSATGIVNRAKEKIKDGYQTILKGVKNLTSLEVYNAAKNGDKLSKEILEDAGKYLGIAIATLINLLNLELIIIGGNVADAWEFIYKPMKEELKKRALRIPLKGVEVKKAKLKTLAGLIGSAKLVFEQQKKTSKI